MNYFHSEIPSFVSIQGDHFLIDNKKHESLHVVIQKIQPVRKLFQDGRLICYSMDGRIANSGRHCLFCENTYRCQKKLRLCMLDVTKPVFEPIILDINQPSFPSLEILLGRLGEDQLHTTPVSLKIVHDEHDRRIVQFTE
jgi:hypothetical protein